MDWPCKTSEKNSFQCSLDLTEKCIDKTIKNYKFDYDDCLKTAHCIYDSLSFSKCLFFCSGESDVLLYSGRPASEHAQTTEMQPKKDKRESKEEIQNNQLCNFKTVQAINSEFGDLFQNLRGNILTLVSRNSPPLMFP